MGSIDITINWQVFEKACLVGASYSTTGGVLEPHVTGPNLTNTAHRYYSLDDLCIKTDLVSLDRSYVSMLQGMVSSSPVGLPIPYSSYAVLARGFTNAGSNSIYLSKGVSYMKRLFLGFRNMNHASNQYVCKSQYKFADAFRMFQAEVGGRLIPEHPIRDITTAYQELQKTCGNYVAGGGLLDRHNYFNIPNPLAHAPYCPGTTVTGVQAEPHGEPDQAFVLGLNFERSLGSGLLSGRHTCLTATAQAVC